MSSRAERQYAYNVIEDSRKDIHRRGQNIWNEFWNDYQLQRQKGIEERGYNLDQLRGVSGGRFDLDPSVLYGGPSVNARRYDYKPGTPGKTTFKPGKVKESTIPIGEIIDDDYTGYRPPGGPYGPGPGGGQLPIQRSQGPIFGSGPEGLTPELRNQLSFDASQWSPTGIRQPAPGLNKPFVPPPLGMTQIGTRGDGSPIYGRGGNDAIPAPDGRGQPFQLPPSRINPATGQPYPPGVLSPTGPVHGLPPGWSQGPNGPIPPNDPGVSSTQWQRQNDPVSPHFRPGLGQTNTQTRPNIYDPNIPFGPYGPFHGPKDETGRPIDAPTNDALNPFIYNNPNDPRGRQRINDLLTHINQLPPPTFTQPGDTGGFETTPGTPGQLTERNQGKSHPGVYDYFKDFADTGGYSDRDRSLFRARTTNQIPAIENILGRRDSRLFGGAAEGQIGRDFAQMLTDARLGSEVDLQNIVNQGRQFGTRGLLDVSDRKSQIETENLARRMQAMGMLNQLYGTAHGETARAQGALSSHNTALNNAQLGVGQNAVGLAHAANAASEQSKLGRLFGNLLSVGAAFIPGVGPTSSMASGVLGSKPMNIPHLPSGPRLAAQPIGPSKPKSESVVKPRPKVVMSNKLGPKTKPQPFGGAPRVITPTQRPNLGNLGIPFGGGGGVDPQGRVSNSPFGFNSNRPPQQGRPGIRRQAGLF